MITSPLKSKMSDQSVPLAGIAAAPTRSRNYRAESAWRQELRLQGGMHKPRRRERPDRKGTPIRGPKPSPYPMGGHCDGHSQCAPGCMPRSLGMIACRLQRAALEAEMCRVFRSGETGSHSAVAGIRMQALVARSGSASVPWPFSIEAHLMEWGGCLRSSTPLSLRVRTSGQWRLSRDTQNKEWTLFMRTVSREAASALFRTGLFFRSRITSILSRTLACSERSDLHHGGEA